MSYQEATELMNNLKIVDKNSEQNKEPVKLEPNQCAECLKKNNNARDLERHNWTYHPKNKYEKAWSRHERNGWQNYSGSTYYQDDPYY